MDRKGIIAVALAVATLIGWMYWNNLEMKRYQAAMAQVRAAAAAEAAANPPFAAPAGTTTSPAPAPVAPAAPVEPAAPEKVETLSSALVDYTFTSEGGGITKALLKTHEAERGTQMMLNEFGSVPIGAVTEIAGEGARVPFNMTVDAAGGVVFERTDARQLQMTKKFTVPQERGFEKDYLVQLDVTFTNGGAQSVSVPGYFVHTGSAAPVHQSDLPNYTGFLWEGGKLIDVTWFSSGWFNPERAAFAESRPGVVWAGVVNQYFTTIVTAQADANADALVRSKNLGAFVWARRFAVSDEAWKTSKRSTDGSTAGRNAIDGALGMPAFTLEPGNSFTQSFRLYTGPREYDRLRRMPNDEAEIMDFGMFGIVSKVLLNSMNWLHSKLGTYAAAIVVLTLLIKTLLWPLQNKATNSMKRMQLLQPKMTELREKYPDDPTRMNTEIMKLYKDYGVNPVGGCLPMLVQIPIFFGFYNMLGKAVELRNSRFLWVDDLSLPDTVFHVAGFPVNVLPLLMAATMLWQMAISPKSGDAMQQRIFMFMPVIFVVFCYNFASALALYWTVQNLFSVVQLYATRNQAPPTLQKVTASAKRK